MALIDEIKEYEENKNNKTIGEYLEYMQKLYKEAQELVKRDVVTPAEVNKAYEDAIILSRTACDVTSRARKIAERHKAWSKIEGHYTASVNKRERDYYREYKGRDNHPEVQARSQEEDRKLRAQSDELSELYKKGGDLDLFNKILNLRDEIQRTTNPVIIRVKKKRNF